MKTITNLWKSFFGKGFAAVFSDFAKYDAEGTEIHTALASQVSDVGYDTTNKKLTKTVGGTTSDVVTAATLKADMSLDNVDNKSSATLKTEFTGSVAQNDTGFPTGGDVYTAIVNNGQGVAAFDITLVSGALPSTGLPTFIEVYDKYSAGYNVLLRVTVSYNYVKIYELRSYYSVGIPSLTFLNETDVNVDYIRVTLPDTWSMGTLTEAATDHYHGDNSTTGLAGGGTAPTGVTDAAQKNLFGDGSWNELYNRYARYSVTMVSTSYNYTVSGAVSDNKGNVPSSLTSMTYDEFHTALMDPKASHKIIYVDDASTPLTLTLYLKIGIKYLQDGQSTCITVVNRRSNNSYYVYARFVYDNSASTQFIAYTNYSGKKTADYVQFQVPVGYARTIYVGRFNDEYYITATNNNT